MSCIVFPCPLSNLRSVHVKFHYELSPCHATKAPRNISKLIKEPSDVALSLKAMTHQPTQLLSMVGLGPVGIFVIGLQLDFLVHSSLVPDCLVGSGPSYDSTVELGWLMCHCL